MASIDLRDEHDAIVDLTTEFIETVGRPDADKPFGLYFVSGESDFAALPKFVEQQEFWKRFRNDKTTMSNEYDKFDAFSTFVLIVDHAEREPIGAARIIEPISPRLKSLDDIEATPEWGVDVNQILERHPMPFGRSRLGDIATLAVRSDATNRQAGITAGTLIHGIYQLALATSTETYVAVIDEIVAAVTQAVGIEMQTICDLPAVNFLGSPESRPILISVSRMTERAAEGPPASTTLMAATYEEACSMPSIDLRTSAPHPVAIEPQFRGDAERVPQLTLLAELAAADTASIE